MRTFAKLISALFHPLLMLTYGVGIALYCTHLNELTASLKCAVLTRIFLTSALFPSLLIALLIHRGIVADAELTNRRERSAPYLIFILGYAVSAFYLQRMHMPLWIVTGIAGCAAALVIALVINLFWKISAHSIGIGGLLGSVLGVTAILGIDPTPAFIILILAAGLVGVSRLYLGRHTPLQVYAGFLLGLFTVSGLLTALHRFFYH
ncbi:MAG: phosphatase PAP2 family protein [Tannerellaceae bacterium]|jgi:membrane-associated phospholipid phosphatase|nr:phosphatase PAP2 family protein [Tannerellaceae bacterium]